MVTGYFLIYLCSWNLTKSVFVMEKRNCCFQEMLQKLQTEARLFLTESVLVLKGLFIRPKEIEVYYYEKGIFEDNSVHRNDLQKNNKNHFYVHRCGTKYLVSWLYADSDERKALCLLQIQPWLSANEILPANYYGCESGCQDSVKWLPADLEVIKALSDE